MILHDAHQPHNAPYSTFTLAVGEERVINP